MKQDFDFEALLANIQDIANKIVKLVFDILAVFGIEGEESPVQPK
jgi:hypothetical protein